MSHQPSPDLRGELEQLERKLRNSDNLVTVIDEILHRLTVATDAYSLAYLNYLIVEGYCLYGSPHKIGAHLETSESYARLSGDKLLLQKIQVCYTRTSIPHPAKEKKAIAMEVMLATDPSSAEHQNALINLILVDFNERNYADALNRCYDLLIKGQKSERIPSQYDAYVKLGGVHSEMGEYHLALYYFERSLDVATALSKRYVLGSVGLIAIAHWHMGNCDEAIRLFRSIVSNKQNASEHALLFFRTYFNLANIYLLKGNSKRARYYLKSAATYGDLNDPSNAYLVKILSAEIHIVSSQYTIAIEDLTDALALGDAQKRLYHNRHIWKLLSLTYEQQGDTTNALSAYKTYIDLTQQEHSKILAAQKLLQRAQVDFRIAQEHHRQEHEHITYLQETVSEQELAIADLTAKLSLKEKILHDFWYELWKEHPQLSAHFSKQLKSSQLRDELKQQLSHPKQPKKLANKFTQSLASRHPTLTPTELQVLVYALLGLSSMETASILKTSDRTIDHHRQNARKKMQLPRSSSLTTYLKSIDMETQAKL